MISCDLCKWDGPGIDVCIEDVKSVIGPLFCVKIFCTICGWANFEQIPKVEVEWME